MKPNMGPGQWVVVWLGVACLGMLASPGDGDGGGTGVPGLEDSPQSDDSR